MKGDLEHKLLIAAGHKGFGVVADELGKDVSQVSRWFSKTQGIPLADIERFLGACGYEAVPAGNVVISTEDYVSLKRFAQMAMQNSTIQMNAKGELG
jgi:hypothetical protein